MRKLSTMSVFASHIWSSKKDREYSLRVITLVYLGLFLLNGSLFLALTIWLISTQINSCDYISYFSIEIWLGFASSLIFLSLGIATCVTTAKKKNQDKIRTFFIITLIGSLLQIVATGFSSVHHTQVYDDTLQMFLEKTVLLNYTAEERAKTCLDNIQTTFKCCGITHRHDLIFAGVSSTYPNSCKCTYTKKGLRDRYCNSWPTDPTQLDQAEQSVFKRPCLGEVQKKLSQQCNVFRYFCPVSITVNFVQLFVAYCVALKIQNHSVVDIYKVRDSQLTLASNLDLTSQTPEISTPAKHKDGEGKEKGDIIGKHDDVEEGWKELQVEDVV